MDGRGDSEEEVGAADLGRNSSFEIPFFFPAKRPNAPDPLVNPSGMAIWRLVEAK